MRNEIALYSYSVGHKVIVALTGLFLCSFLVVHLSINFLLFKNDGGQSFNTMAESMDSSWIIHGLEIVLAAGFLSHIVYAVRVWIRDQTTRPTGYAVNKPSQNSALSSRTMIWSASVIFIFLVIHMKDFWVPTRFPGPTKASYFEMVSSAFRNPVYDAFYLVAIVLLGYHLRHGFQSAFQTFGIRAHWKNTVDAVAVIFWLLIPVGFATMPLYFLFSR
jgi:succinate dehydrogenase / fumarate reductase, cytochrome b subunit